MKLGIMQPYLFPYLGYFQLINAVDRFVVYDDVQYINRGWINRNRILANGEAMRFTLPVQGASRDLAINQRRLAADAAAAGGKILRQIELAYRRAPFFSDVFETVAASLNFPENNLALFVTHSLKRCCDYLAIDTPFTLSSETEVSRALKGQKRIIAINKKLGSSHYINPAGGMELYDKQEFSRQNLRLSFLRSRPVPYRQFDDHFVPDLSIIDVMMFNPRDRIRAALEEFDLL